jgi:hypothetical protein
MCPHTTKCVLILLKCFDVLRFAAFVVVALSLSSGSREASDEGVAPSLLNGLDRVALSLVNERERERERPLRREWLSLSSTALSLSRSLPLVCLPVLFTGIRGSCMY